MTPIAIRNDGNPSHPDVNQNKANIGPMAKRAAKYDVK